MTQPATPVPYGRPYITPECREGYTNPDFRHGCRTCLAPGYQHRVLGWVKVECACPHHTEEAL
jgi:hypothetical protein